MKYIYWGGGFFRDIDLNNIVGGCIERRGKRRGKLVFGGGKKGGGG